MGSILRCSILLTEKDMTHICILSIKDKKMWFIHIAWVYFVYIMPSCLRRYSVFINLIPQMHVVQRSMGRVIVVDAGRSRSTCLRRDAYINDHCLEYHHNYALFYKFPSSICLPTILYVLEREASSENYAPGSSLSYIKSKIPCCNLFTIILFCILFYLSTTAIFDPCK